MVTGEIHGGGCTRAHQSSRGSRPAASARGAIAADRPDRRWHGRGGDAMNVSPLRYFLVVLHPAHTVAALVAIAALGLWMIVISPGELDSALGLLLVAQMFLASTGLLVRARRGHFDQVFTSQPARRLILVSHWIASVAHGVAAWVVVSGVA